MYVRLALFESLLRTIRRSDRLDPTPLQRLWRFRLTRSDRRIGSIRCVWKEALSEKLVFRQPPSDDPTIGSARSDSPTTPVALLTYSTRSSDRLDPMCFEGSLKRKASFQTNSLGRSDDRIGSIRLPYNAFCIFDLLDPIVGSARSDVF